MFSKLKQLKDLKDKAKALQEILGDEKAEGTSSWGKVKVTVNGNQQVVTVAIEQDALADKTKLEEMIKEAVNDAMTKIQRILSSKLREGGGMDIMKEFGGMMQQ
jgi:DNA-binding YbaB/EbfC family protein